MDNTEEAGEDSDSEPDSPVNVEDEGETEAVLPNAVSMVTPGSIQDGGNDSSPIPTFIPGNVSLGAFDWPLADFGMNVSSESPSEMVAVNSTSNGSTLASGSLWQVEEPPTATAFPELILPVLSDAVAQQQRRREDGEEAQVDGGEVEQEVFEAEQEETMPEFMKPMEEAALASFGGPSAAEADKMLPGTTEATPSWVDVPLWHLALIGGTALLAMSVIAVGTVYWVKKRQGPVPVDVVHQEPGQDSRRVTRRRTVAG
jgi:hypothetical protein